MHRPVRRCVSQTQFGAQSGCAFTRAVRHHHRPSVHVNSFSRNLDLLRAVWDQAREEAGPWVGDLIQPALALGQPPPPLDDTQPPTSLGDNDSKFVRVDDLTVHYKERVVTTSTIHEDEAPTILLLHGFNGSVFNWRFTMDGLLDASRAAMPHDPIHRVLAFDRPPFGLTQRPRVTIGRTANDTPSNTDDPTSNVYTPPGAAQLAQRLLQTLGVRRVIVVGHSAGAGVAMEMAIRYPSLVQGMVLVCPALPDADGRLFSLTLGTQLRLAATRALLARDDTGRRYVRRVIGRRRQEVLDGRLRLYADGTAPEADAVDGYLRPMQAHDWDVGMLETMRAFSLAGQYDYAALPQPVLTVQGELDEPLATQARKGAVAPIQVHAALAERQRVPTRYVELPGVGHIPMEEAADATVGAVREWLLTEWAPHAASGGR